MKLFLPTDDVENVSTRRIEGTRLALLKQRQINLTPRELFKLYFDIFLAFEEIEEANTPFLKRQVGPAWFTQDFPATNLDDEEEVYEIWLAFLSPTILFSRLGISKKYLGLVGYQPNLVSLQFGFSQLVPKSLFQSQSEIVSGNSGVDEDYFNRRMKEFEEKSYQINPFPYHNSLYCTVGFGTW
jgi:hypothetical protein